MIAIQRGFWVAILGLLLVIHPATGRAQDNPEEDLQTVISLVKDQNRKLSGDLRRIQREIAALRAELEKPGVKDVAAGIGYIFGLFGVAAYVASRRKR